MGHVDRRKCKCCLKLFRPDPRAQASKLSHDSSYATGAKCLLEWARDKAAESKVYTPTRDD
jgi:hypothetical protein